MKSAPLGWPLQVGVVFNTLDGVQARCRAGGCALKAGDALALEQAGALLFIHSSEIANPCGLQA